MNMYVFSFMHVAYPTYKTVYYTLFPQKLGLNTLKYFPTPLAINLRYYILIVNKNGAPYIFRERIHKHALLVSITKFWEVQFPFRLLLIVHCRFATNATQIPLGKSNGQKLEGMQMELKNIHTPYQDSLDEVCWMFPIQSFCVILCEVAQTYFILMEHQKATQLTLKGHRGPDGGLEIG